MKILRIVSSGFEEGGVENGIVLMQPLLKARDCEVRIMASDRRMDLPRFDNYTFKGVNSFRFAKYFYRIFNPHSFFALRKVLKEYKPDLVQLHTLGEVSPSVLFLLKHVPTVLTIHGPEEFTPSLLMWYLPRTDFKDQSHRREQLTTLGKLHYFYARYISGSVYRLGMRNVDTFVVFSHYMQKLMATDGIPAQYVPNGTTLLEEKPLPHNETIAYAGRLEKFKGVDHLIKAMPAIIKERSNARLKIAGDGSYRKDLERLVRDLAIEKNVEFLGHLSRPETKQLYESSVMLAIPSIWPEAFGKVGIEAMSVGRPVVATDVGGISDWLADNEVGYLVPPGNPGAIAGAVIKLLSDRTQLEHMAVRARKQAEKFSLERHADLMLDLYKKVVAQ